MHPNDPTLRSFIPVDPASDFPIQNLPYGVFSTAASPTPRVGVAIGDYVLDLAVLEAEGMIDLTPAFDVFPQPSINAFMALGPKIWSRTRARISELLRHDHPQRHRHRPHHAAGTGRTETQSGPADRDGAGKARRVRA